MKLIITKGLAWIPVANEILLAIVLIDEAAQRFKDWRNKRKSNTTTDTPEDNEPEEVK